ncbi:MAG: ABC transporter permease [Isosphaeraceae bacterium]|nr:ABC transporter permease [Isosphaeraceae bacterium]
MRRASCLGLLIALLAIPVSAHDIPNARVDRSIQVLLHPGHLEVDYEVSLAELTLAQDLRALIGPLPGADREVLFDCYGRETGPLNAKGLLVSVDGAPISLKVRGFDLAVEEHPRYTFHFEAAALPPRGRLKIQDTNYASSEGMSRLALRGAGGVLIRGDALPTDVEQIPWRPVWQLSDEEERRTKGLDVEYDSGIAEAHVSVPPRPAPRSAPPPPRDPPSGGLPSLLDRAAGASVLGLWLLALGLGVVHAVQPGHGKALVAAAVAGRRGQRFDGVLLALLTTLTHTSSVLVVAAALWATRSTRYAELNAGLAHVAGFTIAAIGLWRLGRHLAGYGEHEAEAEVADVSRRGLLGLGLAGGLVPCWDAVILIIVAEALGRLELGLVLLSAFALGMAAVLVAVAWLAGQLRGFVTTADRDGTWQRRLGIAGALALACIGLSLLVA